MVLTDVPMEGLVMATGRKTLEGSRFAEDAIGDPADTFGGAGARRTPRASEVYGFGLAAMRAMTSHPHA